MRIIAGEFRSRRLKSPPGEATRPTPDRLREALFNVLQSRIEDVVFLDAHAGSGAVGLEALSRGARQVIFIERARAALNVIRENLSSLKALARARVIHGSAATYLASQTADIVFLDPPYDRPDEYTQCLSILGANPPSLVIAQHATRHPLEEYYGRLRRTRVLRQGDNSLSFYEAVE
jgi:16S rRNA (guanine(966)-N(2))-methyltransferase RsmD